MENRTKKIVLLNENEEWEKVQNDNTYSELIIFKFSPYCSISYRAEKIFRHWFDGINEEKNIIGAKVNVISAKSVSGKIAEDLRIEHESPQVIWLDSEGNVKWTASHFEITEKSLNSNLS